MSIFSDGAKSAFDVAKSLSLTLTAQCVAFISQTYDAGTGTYTDVVQTDNVNLIRYDFNTNQIDGNSVKTGDTRFLVQVSELTESNYSHIDVGSEKWIIKNTENEPSNSIKIFHCRLQNG